MAEIIGAIITAAGIMAGTIFFFLNQEDLKGGDE